MQALPVSAVEASPPNSQTFSALLIADRRAVTSAGVDEPDPGQVELGRGGEPVLDDRFPADDERRGRDDVVAGPQVGDGRLERCGARHIDGALRRERRPRLRVGDLLLVGRAGRPAESDRSYTECNERYGERDSVDRGVARSHKLGPIELCLLASQLKHPRSADVRRPISLGTTRGHERESLLRRSLPQAGDRRARGGAVARAGTDPSLRGLCRPRQGLLRQRPLPEHRAVGPHPERPRPGCDRSEPVN